MSVVCTHECWHLSSLQLELMHRLSAKVSIFTAEAWALLVTLKIIYGTETFPKRSSLRTRRVSWKSFSSSRLDIGCYLFTVLRHQKSILLCQMSEQENGVNGAVWRLLRQLWPSIGKFRFHIYIPMFILIFVYRGLVLTRNQYSGTVIGGSPTMSRHDSTYSIMLIMRACCTHSLIK